METITLKEAVAWKQAARAHEAAIAVPGARCASSPCPICASFGELYRQAAEDRLDDRATCPAWLREGIAFYRRYSSFYAEGRRAHFGGQFFEFIKGEED